MLLLLIATLNVEVWGQRANRESAVAIRNRRANALQLPVDSLRNDSIPVDSVAEKKKKSALDAPVSYEATDSIVFTQGGFAYLFGQGKVTYPGADLEAAVISMDMDSNTVTAQGVLDSLGAVVGRPVFKDGETSYETDTIRYNFKSKKGLISNVVSQQGEGYVVGNNAKKNAKNEMFLKDGKYTTCDHHDHPHFYIQMTYGKVRPKKNVVAGPAYLVVEDVPLPFVVPFFFFPFSSSYQSGFLMPTYMDDSNRGFGLVDGGYYFAISEKMDMKLRGDIFTKGSWALNVESNYVKRYKYSGLLQANYQVTKTGDKGIDQMVAKDFKIVWSHRQDPKARPNTTFTASVNFATSSYERTNIGNMYNAQAMSQNTKTSSISYSRTFPEQKLNISASANIAQNMRDSSIAVTLPDLNVSLSTIFPFKRKRAVGNERWYEKISFRYTGRMKNSITTKDDRLFKSNIIKDWDNGIQHDIPVSATFTLFKYFNVTPSVNYTERWYARKVKYGWDTEKNREVATDTIYGFNRVYNFNASLGINTKIYGMYKPIFLPKKAIQIRHVITPSISISAAPDFTSERFGYYDTYIKEMANGVRDTVSYSYYKGMAFGVPSGGKQGNISFSISNNLEMKYKDKNDSIRKVSLIDELGASISYNMAAQTRPWSNLNLNLRLKLGKNYTFSMASTFATYAYEFDKNGNVVVGDRTEWSYGRFGRWSGYGTSFSYTLNNETFKKLFKKGDDTTEDGNGSMGEETGEGMTGEELDHNGIPKKKVQRAEADDEGYQAFKMPWSINLSTGFNITEDRTKPINKKNMRYPYKVSINSLNINGNLKLTNKWNVTFNTGYDFNAKEITNTSFNITRDLHCFTISAAVAPFGRYRYYNFTIRATANILQDLKWEQRSQTQSNIQWY